MSKDYYKILGLSDSDRKLKGKDFEKKLKDSHKALCRKWHPDRFGKASEEERKKAEEMMKDINEAYEVLKDADKRKKYDNPQPNYEDFGFHGFDMSDMDDFFGRHREERKPRGSDIVMKIPISIDEIYNGCTKKVKYKRYVRCKDCNGVGGKGKTVCPYCHGRGKIVETKSDGRNFMQFEHTCPHCHGKGYKFEHPCQKCGGTGFEIVEEIVEVKFDKGVIQGEEYKLMGKGNHSSDPNGIDGSFIAIAVYNYDSSKFNLNHFPHIVKRVKINFVDALLGGEMKINLEGIGEQNVKIPECSKQDDIIKLHGKGLPVRQEYWMESNIRKGDYILSIDVVSPKSLTSEQKELLKKFKETLKR